MAGTELLDLGRVVATQLAASEGAAAAFLAGSIVAGLGSGTSDVDVYLVGTGLRESRRQLRIGGVRVDVHTLATDTLTGLVERVLPEHQAPFRGHVADADLTMAVRLLTAEVVTDTGCLTTLKERLAACPLPLRRMVISSWARTAYSAVEDVAGLLDSADPLDLDAAIMAGRRALLAVGKALAASCGDLYYGEIWVWRQLARSAPAAFPLAEFRRLMHNGALETGGLAELVCFAQTCLSAATTLGGWDVPLEHWPSWTDEGGPLRRATFFLPYPSDAATLIAGPGALGFRVPAEALLIWGLCNGVSADQVVGRATVLRAFAEPLKDVSDQQCRAIVRELADAALIVGAKR
jgi:hypothetical protein